MYSPGLLVGLAGGALVVGAALHPVAGFLLLCVGLLSLLTTPGRGERSREVAHEVPAWLGRDGLRQSAGFVRRSEMRVFEVTRDVVTIKTYGGDHFELRGSTKALAEARHLAAARVEEGRDEELEKLVLRAAEQPRISGAAYRASELVSPEQALAVATDPRCPPNVRVAALGLVEDATVPEVRARIETAADDAAHPEVEEALRAKARGA